MKKTDFLWSLLMMATKKYEKCTRLRTPTVCQTIYVLDCCMAYVKQYVLDCCVAGFTESCVQSIHFGGEWLSFVILVLQVGGRRSFDKKTCFV